MTSKNLSKSDSGDSCRWLPVCIDPNLRQRGIALAVGMLRDPHLAEDVVHDVYIRLSSRHSLEEIEDLPNYFLKCVTNRCRTVLKSRWYVTLVNGVSLDKPVNAESKEATMELEDPRRNPAASAEHTQEMEIRQRILESACEDLTAREKALLLRHLQGDSPTKIAQDWGVEVAVIRVVMNRVLAKIRYRVRRDLKNENGQ